MNEQELLPHLFRTEYRKIVVVLCRLFGIDHIETAEDLVSDTFLQAAELWGLKGLPENPTAWLYHVAKNKTKDYLKRNALFAQKIARDISSATPLAETPELDLSGENIRDSQLAMMFAVCHPCIAVEAQIGLSLNLLCGFGVSEIADAFLSNNDAIYKRLSRAKKQLRTEQVKIELPSAAAINSRLGAVLTTLYLLFNEGYYSASGNMILRKELCLEAMRLVLLLIDHEPTNKPAANALLSLMCYHASRFDARIDGDGAVVLYEDQDRNLWNNELIEKGNFYLNQSSKGNELNKYHLEAAIAYWHTEKEDHPEKWERILQLYNRLLLLEYSPMAALNRTYALAKANGKDEAIAAAEKLGLDAHHLYHSLLGHLYTGVDSAKALAHYQSSYSLAKSAADKQTIKGNIERLKEI